MRITFTLHKCHPESGQKQNESVVSLSLCGRIKLRRAWPTRIKILKISIIAILHARFSHPCMKQIQEIFREFIPTGS